MLPSARDLRTLALFFAVSATAAVSCHPSKARLSGLPPGDGQGGPGGNGNGDGGLTDGGCHFAQEVLYPADPALVALTLGDLDGDGRPDVVAAGGSALQVWLALPDAGLQGPASYLTAGATAAVAVARFDDDSQNDVAVANREPQNSTELFAGLPGGGLASPVFGPGRPYVQAAAAGDFDEDGRTDLVLAADNQLNGELYILLNPSALTPFSGQHQLDATGRRAGVATANVRQQGHLDLVATDPLAGKAVLYAGAGDGGFSSIAAVDAGLSPRAIALGDVSGDGIPDAVTVLSNDSAIGLLPGTDAGGFFDFTRLPATGQPVAEAIRDWNRDGRNDVVTAEINPDGLGLFTGLDGGTLTAAGTLTPSSSPRSVAVGDLDGDGAPDIVALLDGGVGVFRSLCP